MSNKLASKTVDDANRDGGEALVKKNTHSNQFLLLNRDSTIKDIQHMQKIVIIGKRMLRETENNTEEIKSIDKN